MTLHELAAIKARNEERRSEARLGFNVSDAIDDIDSLIEEAERLRSLRIGGGSSA